MKSIVYIDVLFLLNFFTNSILLYAVSIAAKKDLGVLMLSVGAGIAALYSCVMFFPQLALIYTFAVKLIFSALLMMLVFKTIKIKEILKLTAIFYLISFAFGGAVFAVMYLTNAGRAMGMLVSGGEIYLNVSAGVLMIGVGCAYIGVYVFSRICQNNYSRDKIILGIKVTIFGKSVNAKALIDTGSSLVEPVSQKPVIVLEFAAVSDILPEQVKGLYAERGEDDMKRLLSAIEAHRDTHKFCLIPFSSIGAERGIMLGIIPDEVEILEDKAIPRKCVIGIHNQNLSPEGAYNALINADILN